MTGNQRRITMYRVTFRDYGGHAYYLHTIDEAKIGPWLAEMFGLFPYQVHSPTQIDIQASEWTVP